MSPKISISLLAAQSDQRLAALARDGHERAFEALVQRYRRPLLRYCRRMRLADARAEDVLQQAFLQAWMAFACGTDVREVRPWLYRIVHNTGVNAMRGPAEGHSELTEAMRAEDALARESDLQRSITLHEALTDVAALPQMQQQAIFLTAVDGQSNDEVASVLGISEGALRGLLHRARTTLRSTAAALTPPQLIGWAAGGRGAAGPTAERVAELSAGGGAAGMAGLLLKGAVVAVTAGAVATGAVAVNSHGQSVASAAHRAPAAGSAGSTAEAPRRSTENAIASSLAPVAQLAARGRFEDTLPPGPGRAGKHGRHGSLGGASGRRGDRSASQDGRSTDSRSSSGSGSHDDARPGQTRDGAGSGREASGDNGGGSSGRSGASDGGGRSDGSGSAGAKGGDEAGSGGGTGSSRPGSGSGDTNAAPAVPAPEPSMAPTEPLASATSGQPSASSGGAGASGKGGVDTTATADGRSTGGSGAGSDG